MDLREYFFFHKHISQKSHLTKCIHPGDEASIAGWLLCFNYVMPSSFVDQRDWGGEIEIAIEIGKENANANESGKKRVAIPKNKSVGLCSHFDRSFVSV